MSVLRPLSGFRAVEVRYGDTLQRIAARTLNDASRWAEIADINGLAPPYLTGDPARVGPKVLRYGSSLYVPAPTPQASADVDPVRVFGVDLDLTGGDLSADETGDFKLVKGRPNLIQALRHRLATPLRELLFHLGYGNGAFLTIGKIAGPTAAALNAQYVRDALSNDKRVAKVDRVVASVMYDTTSVQGEVVPIQGATVDLSSLTGS